MPQGRGSADRGRSARHRDGPAQSVAAADGRTGLRLLLRLPREVLVRRCCRCSLHAGGTPTHQPCSGPVGCFGVHRENVQRTLAKMLLHTGKTIPELEGEDFFEVRAWGVAAGRITHHAGVHGAWELADLLGAATAGRSLKAALREG